MLKQILKEIFFTHIRETIRILIRHSQKGKKSEEEEEYEYLHWDIRK